MSPEKNVETFSVTGQPIYVTGITQSYWSSMSEDKRLWWKMFIRAVALVSGWFVTKTGNPIFDWILGAFTVLFSAFIIETQRSYTKYPEWIQSGSVKISVLLGAWSVTILGIAIFAQIGFGAIISTLGAPENRQFLESQDEMKQLTFILITFIAGLIAVLKVCRGLQIEELIYKMPHQALTNLFSGKVYCAESFPPFAFFELMVLGLSFAYFSMAAESAKTFFRIAALSH